MVGFCWLLFGRKTRIRAHVSAASGLGSLASEFYPGRSTFADATAYLVVRRAGRVSCALRSATRESRSTADDFVLVHQQFVRSSDRSGFDALFRRRTDSLHKPSKHRRFLSLCSIHRSVFVRSEEHTSELQSRFDLV